MEQIKRQLKNPYAIVFFLIIILMVILFLLAIIPYLNKKPIVNNQSAISQKSVSPTTSSVKNQSQTDSRLTNDRPSTSSTILVASKKPVIVGSQSEISRESVSPTASSVKNLLKTKTDLPQSGSTDSNRPSTNSTSNNDLSLLTDLLKILLNTNIPSNISTNSLSPTPNDGRTSQTSSLQKTGIFILSNYSAGAKQIVDAKPKIIKIMDPQQNSNLLQAARDFKNANSSGISVLRVYQGTQNKKYNLNDDPANSAQDFFQGVIAPALNSLGDNKKYFDYIETPNELDNTPGWESNESVAWLSKFWETIIGLDSQSGIRTCVGSIPVGNPPGNSEEIKNKMQIFAPALQKTVMNNGAVCYHAYSLNYTTDVGQESYYSLRYRMLHDIISQINSGFSTLPFILSEAGIDQTGNPQTSGWQARGNGTEYTNWISWFDSEMNKDNYVLGATLFQIGDSNWSSFDLEPIAGWLAGSIK